MDNILLKYMSGRFPEEIKELAELLPIITLSREYGCYASRIAILLTERLAKITKAKPPKEWKYISREVLEKAAEELNLKPEKISHVFGAKEKGTLTDIIESFSSRRYASDAKIKRTITQIVRSYASEGNVVIVGRAGCMIAKDFSKAIHIKLTAPFEWRAKRIANRYKISEMEARNKVMEVDENRTIFMSYFKGNKPESDLFDIIFNRMTLQEEEIVEAIVRVLQVKKFI